MTVISFDEIADGRDGSESMDATNAVSRRVTRVFRAVTNSNTDYSETILSHVDCPRVGMLHPTDVGLWCRGVRPVQEHGKTVWKVTATYASSPASEIDEDPLLDGLQITWGTAAYQRPIWKDINGDAITNVVGEFFDPPPDKDDSRLVITVTVNVVTPPTWMLGYQDVVNNDDFVIDGVTITKGEAKVSGVSLSGIKERNKIFYRTATLQIHIRKEEAEGVLGDEKERMWWLHILNAGFTEWDEFEDDVIEILHPGDKTPVTAPWPLDKNGRMIKKPTPDHADIFFIPFEVYQQDGFANVLPGCFLTPPPTP